MTCDYDAVLDELERLLLAEGTPPEILDERIGERLGVPDRYLQGYRVIRDALTDRPGLVVALDGDAEVPLSLLRAAATVDRVGQLAAEIVRCTGADQPLPAAAGRHAARILGAVLQLREQLRLLQIGAVRDAG